MESNKIHSVLRMKSDHINKIPCGKGCKITLIVDNTIVYGNGTDHSGTLTCKLSAEGLGVSVGGEIHNGFSTHINGSHNLFHFYIIVLAVT